MGKYLLLIVGAVAVGSLTLSHFSSRVTSARTSESLHERGYDVLARAIAQSGLTAAESRLAADLAASGSYSGPSEFTAAYEGGTYVATVTSSGDEYTIHSVGRIEGEEAHAERAYRFERPPTAAPVPAFMGGSIVIDNNLNIKDDFTVLSEDGSTNAVIHANNNISATEGTVYIEGYGYYANNVDFNNGQTPEEVFQPVSNPDGLPVHERRSETDIPEFDASDYLHLATLTTGGNVELSGDVTLGTRDAPVIWYVDGDLTTAADVTIHGYGIIMTRGNVKIRHHVRTAGGDGRSTFALYTGNDLAVESGSLTLEGQFLVGNNLRTYTNTTLVGSIAVGNDLQTKGPFTNSYRPASSELTDPFWPPGPSDDPPEPAEAARLVTVSSRSW